MDNAAAEADTRSPDRRDSERRRRDPGWDTSRRIGGSVARGRPSGWAAGNRRVRGLGFAGFDRFEVDSSVGMT